MPFRRVMLPFLFSMSAFGCAMMQDGSHETYETISADPSRSPQLARKRNLQAIDHLKNGDLGRARAAADQALIADVDYAPAHNTLGLILYRKNDYYLAAWEFEFAIRLYPDVADYHNNLGVVFERAGKTEKAIESYRVAVDLDSSRYQFVSNLSRARVRSGERSPETVALLKKVVFMDPRKEWKDWANQLLVTTHRDIPDAADEFPATKEIPLELSTENSNLSIPPFELQDMFQAIDAVPDEK